MSAGLLHSAQSLLASLLALARTRLELFSTELQEELTRLVLALIGAVVVLLLAALGVAFAGLALIIAIGEQYRFLVAASFALGLIALAAVAWWSLRRLGRDKPRALAATLAELERDHDALEP
ncbi:MAG: hypothetical protein A3G81_23995 [Betaproteobacteria bacterium RIFCSPLOWO2_12_FULL_65_14]|nr:MAG: hypothetical protein A3G81_23995 [Betaproteobacteria bacterium RIFCSPLOWO2_12_FULL_65_14]